MGTTLRTDNHTLLKSVTHALPDCPGALYAQWHGLVHGLIMHWYVLREQLVTQQGIRRSFIAWTCVNAPHMPSVWSVAL